MPHAALEDPSTASAVLQKTSFVYGDKRSTEEGFSSAMHHQRGARVGSPFFCHLCHRNHYYSQCPDFKNDIVCFYNELDEGMYVMQNSEFEKVTMGDVYMFIREHMGVWESQVRFIVGSVETSNLPAVFMCSQACIVPGVVVCVMMNDAFRLSQQQHNSHHQISPAQTLSHHHHHLTPQQAPSCVGAQPQASSSSSFPMGEDCCNSPHLYNHQHYYYYSPSSVSTASSAAVPGVYRFPDAAAGYPARHQYHHRQHYQSTQFNQPSVVVEPSQRRRISHVNTTSHDDSHRHHVHVNIQDISHISAPPSGDADGSTETAAAVQSVAISASVEQTMPVAQRQKKKTVLLMLQDILMSSSSSAAIPAADASTIQRISATEEEDSVPIPDVDQAAEIRRRCTVHVKYIPSTLTCFEQRELFDLSGGHIRKIRIAKSFEDSNFSVAFVEFAAEHEALRCIETLTRKRIGLYKLSATVARSAIRGVAVADSWSGGNPTDESIFGQKKNSPTDASPVKKSIPQQSNEDNGAGVVFSQTKQEQRKKVVVERAFVYSSKYKAGDNNVFGTGMTTKLPNRFPSAVFAAMGSLESSTASPLMEEVVVKGPLHHHHQEQMTMQDLDEATAALIQTLRYACAAYVADPIEPLYFTAMDAIARAKETIIGSPCHHVDGMTGGRSHCRRMRLTLAKTLAMFQIVLFHLALLIHHANPSDFSEADAMCKKWIERKFDFSSLFSLAEKEKEREGHNDGECRSSLPPSFDSLKQIVITFWFHVGLLFESDRSSSSSLADDSACETDHPVVAFLPSSMLRSDLESPHTRGFSLLCMKRAYSASSELFDKKNDHHTVTKAIASIIEKMMMPSSSRQQVKHLSSTCTSSCLSDSKTSEQPLLDMYLPGITMYSGMLIQGSISINFW